jgi:hypothetical protein
MACSAGLCEFGLSPARARDSLTCCGVALYLLTCYFAFRFGGDGGKGGSSITG